MNMPIRFPEIRLAELRAIRRLSCWRIIVATLLVLVLQPLGFCEFLSAGHRWKSTGEESISIVRVKDDLMVEWVCPAFQKTSLVTLGADGEWKAMDEAWTPTQETQYYSLRRDSRRGFFRTSSEELQQFPRMRMMMPRRFISGLPTPVRVEVLKGNGSVDWEVWEGETFLSSFNSNVRVFPATFSLHNGVASGLVSIEGIGEATVIAEFSGEWADRSVASLDPAGEMTVAGELSDPVTIWKPGDGVIHVTDDVTIPAEHLLEVYPDTIVLLDPKKSIIVHGTIVSLGTVEHPVLFAAADPENPWGEISHADTSTKSTYKGTFFIGGGDSPAAGHTGRGPVIRVNHAEIEFDYCNIMDNYGKGLYGSHGNLTFTHCLFSRSAMGMEVVNTDIGVDKCFFLEMPMGGDVGDNDPIYLHGGGDMSVTNSVFAIGGDDGIDTLSSQPLIENCIVHGFLDKGITVYYGAPRINNCLVLYNDYGISAKGDGTDVYVDKTTVAGNRCSLQSRDKYGVPDAVIKYFVTNSIVWDTGVAIQTDYPIEDISITYSVVPAAEPFPGDGNITDDPRFVEPDANDFRLDEDSPCRGAGQNGVDMGFAYPDPM